MAATAQGKFEEGHVRVEWNVTPLVDPEGWLVIIDHLPGFMETYSSRRLEGVSLEEAKVTAQRLAAEVFERRKRFELEGP